MTNLKSLLIALAGLTVLVVACAPDTETQPPTPTAEVAPVVEEATLASTTDPEDLLRNGRVPFEGEMILVGGQPSPEQFASAQRLGYKTIVNLRLPDEKDNTDPEQIRSLGMNYVSFPMTGSADLTQGVIKV